MKDEILSYREMCNKIQVNTIQRGMNFHIKKGISVILMSVRPGAPYDDEIDIGKNLLIYEGHDVQKSKQNPEPKKIDQPRWTDNGTLTENGKFVKAVENHKKGLIPPEKILVFEKLNSGIWSEKGLFSLIDYETRISNDRKVLKFILKPIDENIDIPKGKDDDEHNRLIPTQVKVAVWKRDKGNCVLCGSTKNLHYDHDVPFSKGGSSITEKNVRILCAKCNLKKHDKIE
ncbi:MAG: HNH endonuclease [Candidatus Woesearchaeota archaeon]|nr:HNH endonuclease [Candidatus Woesearchaeota archaeon]